MRRSELEHILRAAGAISGVKEWVIVGSQAILGAFPNAPAELLVSEEVDLYAPDHEAASDLIDGSIGERSPFHETFGYYAHGVGMERAKLPPNWRSRAIAVQSPMTAEVSGICPHPPISRSANSPRGARRITISCADSCGTGSPPLKKSSCGYTTRSGQRGGVALAAAHRAIAAARLTINSYGRAGFTRGENLHLGP